MMMTKPGRQHEEVVKVSASLALGSPSQLLLLCFNAQCHGVEKAPESECDGMVSNSPAFGGWLMVPNITDYLAESWTCCGQLLRVVISRCPWVHAQGRRQSSACSVLKSGILRRRPLLMLDCDRSLASHRYTYTIMTQKMEMKIADGGSLSRLNGLDPGTCLSIVR
jgi:hypothetical protein